MFNHTSTEWAIWYVISADHKWLTRLVVAGIIYNQLKEVNLKYSSRQGEEGNCSLRPFDGVYPERSRRAQGAMTKVP